MEHCYEQFLLKNHNPDEREYPDADDQIREVLIYDNYISQKDIEICLGYDLIGLEDHPNFTDIEALHGALHAKYSDIADP